MHQTSRRPLLALTLASAACSGSVHLDEVDGFGLVESAIWQVDTAGSDDSHQIILSNVGGLCGKYQRFFDDYQDIQDDMDDLSDEEDEETLCEGAVDIFQRLAKAARPLYPKNAHFLSIGLSTEDQYLSAEPEEGTWDAGMLDPDTFFLSISYYPDGGGYDELGDAISEIDCGDKSWQDDFSDALDETDVDVDQWAAYEDGELDISSVKSDSRVKASFDADLLDEDEDDAGTVSGGFNAHYCEVDTGD